MNSCREKLHLPSFKINDNDRKLKTVEWVGYIGKTKYISNNIKGRIPIITKFYFKSYKVSCNIKTTLG